MIFPSGKNHTHATRPQPPAELRHVNAGRAAPWASCTPPSLPALLSCKVWLHTRMCSILLWPSRYTQTPNPQCWSTGRETLPGYEGKAGSCSHTPEHGKRQGPSTSVGLPFGSQVTAEGMRVSDHKKEHCQMVYGTNLTLLSSPRPTVLLAVEEDQAVGGSLTQRRLETTSAMNSS